MSKINQYYRSLYVNRRFDRYRYTLFSMCSFFTWVFVISFVVITPAYSNSNLVVSAANDSKIKLADLISVYGFVLGAFPVGFAAGGILRMFVKLARGVR